MKKLDQAGITEAEKFYVSGAAGKRKPQSAATYIPRVHLNAAGAEFYASLFVELAEAQNLPIAKLFK